MFTPAGLGAGQQGWGQGNTQSSVQSDNIKGLVCFLLYPKIHLKESFEFQFYSTKNHFTLSEKSSLNNSIKMNSILQLYTTESSEENGENHRCISGKK